MKSEVQVGDCSSTSRRQFMTECWGRSRVGVPSQAITLPTRSSRSVEEEMLAMSRPDVTALQDPLSWATARGSSSWDRSHWSTLSPWSTVRPPVTGRRMEHVSVSAVPNWSKKSRVAYCSVPSMTALEVLFTVPGTPE